jgi:hypothetical protein
VKFAHDRKGCLAAEKRKSNGLSERGLNALGKTSGNAHFNHCAAPPWMLAFAQAWGSPLCGASHPVFKHEKGEIPQKTCLSSSYF